jgi:SAM-dependent methyltransferase
VAASNLEQLRAWDGEEGDYWARHADRFDDSVAGYHGPLMAAAGIGPADRVLDVGCGTGQTTRDAARLAPAGHALGVDLSGAMLRVARARADAEGVRNASFLQADAQVHPFEAGGFDVVISRTGAMFFGDRAEAFANLARALRPGGRLALVAWQPVPANEWFVSVMGALAAGRDLPSPPPEAPSPFALSDPARVVPLLEGAGFTTPALTPLSEPMRFGDTPEEAHAFLAGLLDWLVRDLDETRRRRALDDLMAVLRAHATPAGVLLGSAMWLVTARRA